jgi:hypothetical protein
MTTMVTFPAEAEGDDSTGIKTWRVPLPGALTGQYFDLVVDAGAQPYRDRAVWVEAQLQRPLR